MIKSLMFKTVISPQNELFELSLPKPTLSWYKKKKKRGADRVLYVKKFSVKLTCKLPFLSIRWLSNHEPPWLFSPVQENFYRKNEFWEVPDWSIIRSLNLFRPQWILNFNFLQVQELLWVLDFLEKQDNTVSRLFL